MITNGYGCKIFLALPGFSLQSKLQLRWHLLVSAGSRSWAQYSDFILDWPEDSFPDHSIKMAYWEEHCLMAPWSARAAVFSF